MAPARQQARERLLDGRVFCGAYDPGLGHIETAETRVVVAARDRDAVIRALGEVGELVHPVLVGLGGRGDHGVCRVIGVGGLQQVYRNASHGFVATRAPVTVVVGHEALDREPQLGRGEVGGVRRRSPDVLGVFVLVIVRFVVIDLEFVTAAGRERVVGRVRRGQRVLAVLDVVDGEHPVTGLP